VNVPPSVNLDGVPVSATLAMTARAAALSAAGERVLSLSAGEPDFDTPAFVREAAVDAIRGGATHYPPVAGLPELREAIAAWLDDACGGSYEAREILVSVGAKQCLFDAVFTLFGPGDRVVVPAPYWVSYPAIVRLARAEPVIVETRPEDGFRLTAGALAEALDAGATGVILNSPSNPTGAILEEGDLAALVAVAAERGAWILADEIYREIRYRTPFASVAPHAREYDRIVLIDGFSKAFAMTGWRVGFAAASAPVVEMMAKLQGHVNTNTATPSQHAALAAVTRKEEREEALGRMVEAFRERRDVVLTGVSEIPGLAALPPDGAFYCWIEADAWCEAVGGDSRALCLDLLEHEHVAVVPGSAFGRDGWIRLSFAASKESLGEAIDRLASAARRIGVV